MTTYDPIPSIEHLGYTPREAAFIYLVVRNSGYFLARQFNWFLRRKGGALTQSFVNKLRAWEHAAIVDYGQNRFVYHLKSKTIYRLIGIENSQNRRLKGDHEIRLRLMALDYLLERLDVRVLSTETEKLEFFSTLPGIAVTDLPSKSFLSASGEGEETLRYFVDRFPITVTEDQVQFAYFDEGAFSTKSFVNHLNRYFPLLSKLTSFQVTYVALNATNFPAAQKEFERLFPRNVQESGRRLLPHGPEHLARFFRAQELWDQNSSDFRPEDLSVLRGGERLYTAPEHIKLKTAWKSGTELFENELDLITTTNQVQAVFRTFLLEQNYPVFGYKNGGSWEGNHDSVLDSVRRSI